MRSSADPMLNGVTNALGTSHGRRFALSIRGRDPGWYEYRHCVLTTADRTMSSVQMPVHSGTDAKQRTRLPRPTECRVGRSRYADGPARMRQGRGGAKAGAR